MIAFFPMRVSPVLAFVFIAGAGALPGTVTDARAVTQLDGAGATFSAPIYQRWFQDYNRIHPDVQVNYQAIGSGAGVEQFIKGTVDFGASDAAMTDEEIARVHNGAVMLPVTAGEIVLAYNLPGVPGLKLSRAAYTGIFLGSVKRWNDPSIKKSNPGVDLPGIPISVVFRWDGSGTTYVFTRHLCALNPYFEQRVVVPGTQVTWPIGVGGRGNDGVVSLIKQRVGAIGYVEYGYARENEIPMAALQNKSGHFVAPNLQSGSSTLAQMVLPPDLRGWAEDPAGANDYPITTFTWLLAYRHYDDPEKARALKNMVLYGITDGQKLAPELGYIPLPTPVVEKVKLALQGIN